MEKFREYQIGDTPHPHCGQKFDLREHSRSTGKVSSLPISRVVTLGGGSAGCIAALTLKRKLPSLHIRIIRSPEIAIIGVGEGTTPNFVSHFHGYLGLPRG